MSAQEALFTDELELAAAATVNRPGPSHREDPETSRIAAFANACRSGTQRARVLLLLDREGATGATADEMAVALNHPMPYVLSTRRGELERLGLCEKADGLQRSTRYGNPSQVYRITETGRDVARLVKP